MPAFKKFGPGDLLDNVLILEPRYNLASGSSGWHGGPAGSGSITLYGGARRSPAGTLRTIAYQPLYPALNQFGAQLRSVPQTASVNMVWMTNDALPTTPTTTVWGQEHFSTVEGLYGYYLSIDPDYVTGTYDYYSLYFQRDSGNVLACPAGRAPQSDLNSSLNIPSLFTGSFTLESWIKPFQTGSSFHDFTVMSVSRLFQFGITGSTGDLFFSSSAGSWTSNFGPQERRWSHVSVSYDLPSRTGYFTVNLLDAGTFTMSPLTGSNSYTGSLLVGGQWGVGSTAVNDDGTSVYEDISQHIAGAVNRSFHGMIGEIRGWQNRRPIGALSASWAITLTGSALSSNGAFLCMRMVEGPLAEFPPNLMEIPMGSGAVNFASVALNDASASLFNGETIYGQMWSFDDRIGPGWIPNDNVTFTPPKELVTVPASGNWPSSWNGSPASAWLAGLSVAPATRMLVVDIPQAFYGRQIVPGSVVMVDRAYSSGSYGLVRTLVDDERGNLYISGSVCSSSLANKEDYQGVAWNKVGNVFYGEGLIVIKEPSLLDFGRTDGWSADGSNTFQLSFRGTTRLPVKTLMCRLDPGEFNCTLNPTFWTEDADGSRVVRHGSSSIRISTVGIYDDDRRLVMVGRYAEPIRKRPRDRINLKLRYDF